MLRRSARHIHCRMDWTGLQVTLWRLHPQLPAAPGGYHLRQPGRGWAPRYPAPVTRGVTGRRRAFVPDGVPSSTCDCVIGAGSNGEEIRSLAADPSRVAVQGQRLGCASNAGMLTLSVLSGHPKLSPPCHNCAVSWRSRFPNAKNQHAQPEHTRSAQKAI